MHHELKRKVELEKEEIDEAQQIVICP